MGVDRNYVYRWRNADDVFHSVSAFGMGTFYEDFRSETGIEYRLLSGGISFGSVIYK